MQQHAAAVLACYLMLQHAAAVPACYLMLQHAAAVPFISLAARQLPVLLSHDQPGMRCHVSFWARDNGLDLLSCVCRALLGCMLMLKSFLLLLLVHWPVFRSCS